MVPKKSIGGAARGGSSAGKGQGRRGKAATKRGREQSTPAEPPAFIDPDLAMVIKHPLRAQIVALAHQRLISPSEFAEGAGISLSAASGHFQALSKVDFLELVEEIKVRGAVKHMYRATKRAYFSAVDWGKLGDEIQKGMGAAVLSDFNSRVTQALEAGTFQARDDVVLFWLGLMLDEDSWPEFVKLLSWAIEEVKEMSVQTVERRANGEARKCFPVTFGIAGFESPHLPSKTDAKPRQRKEAPPKSKKAKAKRRGSAKA